MIQGLDEIERRFKDIELRMQDPDVLANYAEVERLGRARAELEPVIEGIHDLRKAESDLKQAKEMLQDPDPEMRDMAEAEVKELTTRLEKLEADLKLALLPKDPNDDKSVVIEIRPAAGGDEAGLFAYELFRMYQRFAERHRWKTGVIEYQEAGIGGVTKVVFTIDAVGAYSQLKHESGVHRVQRVPATESQGRIHTSTVTVAVLPEAEEVDLDIRDQDLEISSFRSSSAGGQHMQKNDTAIRIVHKPSGIVVTCQDERSQAQNKLKAMTVLRSKLYEMEQDRLAKERGELRKGQIGSGDRSEKIRTYNFPQGRITDHRIGFSLHNMQAFMDGEIEEMIDALLREEREEKLRDQQAALGGVY